MEGHGSELRAQRAATTRCSVSAFAHPLDRPLYDRRVFGEIHRLEGEVHNLHWDDVVPGVWLQGLRG